MTSTCVPTSAHLFRLAWATEFTGSSNTSFTEDDNGSEDGTHSFTVASGVSTAAPVGSQEVEPVTSTLPTTGQADTFAAVAGALLAVTPLCGGLVMRHRTAR